MPDNCRMRDNQPALHFALTSHGLGHVTRSLAVISALHDLLPQFDLVVSSTIDASWIRQQLGFDVECRHQGYEPGAIQRNCFEVDVALTLDAYVAFAALRSQTLQEECRYLESRRFLGVISDIPALPVRAAGHVGIPAIGVSNFTWDWIVRPWFDASHPKIADCLEEDYRAGERLLALPFGPDRSSFPASEPAPLLSRRATLPRNEVRRRLELDEQRLALVCPGGWSADEWPAIHARPGDFQLLTVNDLPVTSDVPLQSFGHRPPDGMTLPDLIAASDVVLGKPGYGLASECVTHKVPFAMIERPNFRETPYLVEQMHQLGRCASTSIEAFFSGVWEPVLEEAIQGGSDWARIDPDPAGTIARRIRELLDL